MTSQIARKRRALRKGLAGEWIAGFALICKGFRIVAWRYRTKYGEIDLIARRGDLVLIVEVKTRATVVDAMNAVGSQAQRRIEAACDHWLSRQGDHGQLSIRFDLIAVVPWRWPVHVENAWHGQG